MRCASPSERTRRAYVFPARHFASDSNDPSLPPMGLRLRLKASFDVSGFPRQARIVLVALKRYGMLVADNGSSWYITGAPDPAVVERPAAHARSRAGLGLRSRRPVGKTDRARRPNCQVMIRKGTCVIAGLVARPVATGCGSESGSESSG